VGDRGSGRPTWAEIDLSALERNLAFVRERAPGRRAIAVVKANGYGHGARIVSAALVSAGADALAVATVAEAAELRSAGLEVPVLLLQGLHAADEADFAHELGLSAVVGDVEALPPLEAAAQRAGRRFPVHVKFDTGMARMGFPSEDAAAVLARFAASEHLELAGVMSHLACADDPDAAETAEQRRRFAEVLAVVRERGLQPEWIHMDNSPAVLHGPTEGTTAIRPGLALYGADPTRDAVGNLVPVMTLCTHISQLRDVLAGTPVGYGATYRTPVATRIATLPIGYADGLPRAASDSYTVGIEGKRVRLAGRVSMDLCSIDVGAGTAVSVGDEVVLFGLRHGLEMPVEELARACGTIAYEILVGIGPRISRVAVRRSA